MTIHTSICRFCHANCGILVEVEQGRAVRVEGDPDNPAYRGFLCAKGRVLAQTLAHPDRLLRSLQRVAPGRHVEIASGTAMDEIAQRVRAIVSAHGPRSVAIYVGTYAGPHPLSIPVAVGWMLALGSKRVFTSSTIDQPGKHIANALHGRWLAGSYTFDESDVWMLVGNNPLVSMSGGIPPSHPARRLRRARKRGAKLIVIDPRRTEVARSADVFLQPRPGQDPALLAAMIHVVIRDRLFDESFVLAHAQGFAALERAVEPWTPAEAARRADVPAEDIEGAAHLFATGARGCAVAGTGPNMAPHGNLTEYLLLCLNTLCGKWRRAGEAVPNPGALLPRATPRAQARGPIPAWGFGEKLAARPFTNTAAGLPTAALADEILHAGDDRIRALFCVGSHPLAAWPDPDKARRALERLDLLVTLDPKMSATARLAHYVIAPKLSLEVPGVSLSSEAIEQTYVGHGYPEPYAQYASAIVEPPPGSDVIEEWELFYGLAQRMGLALAIHPVRPEAGVLHEQRHMVSLDMARKPTTDELYEAMLAESRIALAEVKRHPHGHVFEGEPIVVEPAAPGATERLELGDATMLAELREVLAEDDPMRAEDAAAGFPFRLVSRRLPHVYNSSGRDIDALVRGRRYNAAFVHPDDLDALGLHAGDAVRIRSAYGAIDAIVEPARDVRRGVVSMAHGFGDTGESGADADVRRTGSSTNRLVSNEHEFDPYTGIPRMSAIPVAIEPLAGSASERERKAGSALSPAAAVARPRARRR